VSTKKSGKDKRRNIPGPNSEDDRAMPMPTARKMFFKATNIHELIRNRNQISKLTINSQSPDPCTSTNKTMSEIQMPINNDSNVHLHSRNMPYSLSTPSIRVSQILNDKNLEKSVQIHPPNPNKQPQQIKSYYCNLYENGDGDNSNNIMENIGKRGRMKAPQKFMKKAGCRSKYYFFYICIESSIIIISEFVIEPIINYACLTIQKKETINQTQKKNEKL